MVTSVALRVSGVSPLMQRQSSTSLPRLTLPGLVAMILGWIAITPVEAQLFGEEGLFGEKGLFSKKETAPRPLTEDEIGVPTPVTGRVETLKGQEIQFEIHAETKTAAATVEFLIRDFPTAGRIVSIQSKPLERNRALVTYYADPSSTATSDVFSFAVRYRGGRYSSAIRYDIDLVNVLSEIEVLGELDFGTVTVGNEEVRDISVRNKGNGPFESQLLLAPPWRMVDPPDGRLVLPPRGWRSIKVAFAPELPGETSYFLSMSRSKSGTTKLIGTGAEPFVLNAEELELGLDPVSGERRATLEVTSQSAKGLRLAVDASTRVKASLMPEYFVLPGQTAKVNIALGATDTAPFDGTLSMVLANGYRKTVRLFAPVVPGRIEISVPNSITRELINFGKVEAGKSAERAIIVTNRGGASVPLEFNIPEPFRLLTNPGPQLGPLSDVQLNIGLSPVAQDRGPIDVSMQVLSFDQVVPLRLLANVVGPPGSSPVSSASPTANSSPLSRMRMSSGSAPPSAIPAGSGTGASTSAADPSGGAPSGPALGASAPVLSDPSMPTAVGNDPQKPWYANLETGEIDRLRSPEGFITRPLVERVINPELRSPEDLTMLDNSSRSLVISWTAPRDSERCQFEIEARGTLINEKTGMPESVWVPYDKVKIDRIDRLVKAELTGLFASSTYELRVFTTDENGRSSEPSEMIIGETTLPMDWTYIYAGMGAVLLAALGMGIRRVILNRRPEVYQAKYVDA